MKQNREVEPVLDFFSSLSSFFVGLVVPAKRARKERSLDEVETLADLSDLMTKFGETDQSAQVVRRHTFEERPKLLSGKALVDYADYLYTTGLNVRDFEEVFFLFSLSVLTGYLC